jgi:hypothetical protein
MRAAWPRPAPSLSSSPARRRCTDKISTPLRALHGTHCYPRCALRHVSAHSICRRARRHLPPSLLAHVRVGSTRYTAIKRDLPRAFCMCPHRCLPLVRRHHRTTSVFCRSIGAKPPHPPLSPCAGPGALQGPRAAPRLAHVTSSPPLSSSTVDPAGELRPSAAHLPRFEL